MMAQGTPESDYSIECFQNYTAPEVFVQGLAGIVNQQDVETMIIAQKHMLQRFEKTNEMLTNCIALSASRLKTVGPEFKKHIQTLVEMKKDLDYIFKKIRTIKTKLNTQYPEEFAEAQRNSYAEEVDEENESLAAEKKSATETGAAASTLKTSLSHEGTSKQGKACTKVFKNCDSSSTDSDNTNNFSSGSNDS